MLTFAKSVLVSITLLISLASAQAADLVATGQFTGKSGHVTKGGVEIIKDDKGYIVRLKSDFSLDGAPDPEVGFGRKGKFQKGSQIAPLAKLTGKQAYRLPKSFDLGKIDQVYIWCTQFSVPLGVANLKSP